VVGILPYEPQDRLLYLVSAHASLTEEIAVAGADRAPGCTQPPTVVKLDKKPAGNCEMITGW
jgi:hypothetical protein